MKYFKILIDNIIIGAVNSNEFMRYIPITDCFVRATEQNGEYIAYRGKFYRATWMQPIVQAVDYTEALILEINKEEYDILIEAFETKEEIEQQEEQPIYEEPQEEYIPSVDPIEETTLEFIRSSKLQEMSYACRTTIEAGFNLEIRGETKHFSLTTQDQLNLMSAVTMAQTQDLIPYHADGEECEFYTANEINEISAKATELKNYNLAYYNSLKIYINALETIEDIAAITYGTSIPDEYKSDVLKVLEY